MSEKLQPTFTIEDMLLKADKERQRIAIVDAEMKILEAKYLPRDGAPPAARIKCGRAYVEEGVISDRIEELQQKKEQMLKNLQITLNTPTGE